MGNKFILEGDENKSKTMSQMNREMKLKHFGLMIDDDTGTPIMWKEKGHEIKWKGLTDKNSDELYAPKQLLPQSDYDMRDREIFEKRVSKYRKLLDGAKGIK